MVVGLSRIPRILYVSDCIFFPSILNGQSGYLLDATGHNGLWFDQLFKRHGGSLHGLLGQAIEQLAARCRGPAVESKGELVEIFIQMLVPNRSLMSAEQPSLEQRDDAMNSGQHVLRLPFMALDVAVVDIPVQPHVGGPAVGPDRACRRNGLGDEPMEGRLGQVRDAAETDAPNTFSVRLGGDDNQGLVFRPPADYARFLSPPVGFVPLDEALQPIPARTNHGPAQFIQHPPGVLVAAKTKNTLQT